MSDPFTPFATAPTAGIAPNLVPSPPAGWPEPVAPMDAMAGLSPFVDAQDVDQIILQLSLDRPLPLHIPDREKYTEYEFHIINDTPQEYTAAMRRGWRRIDNPELLRLFEGKVSGSDKEGRIMKPVLMARHRKVGEAERLKLRQKLYEQNKGLDPKNRTFAGGKNALDVSEASFTGMGFTRMFTGPGGPVRR